MSSRSVYPGVSARLNDVMQLIPGKKVQHANDLGLLIYTAVCTITPSTAQAILTHYNKKNRPNIRPQHVARLARAIKTNDFLLSGESVIFNLEGDLADGQHRLTACIEANKAITAIVVFGVRPEVFQVIDQSALRNLKDALQTNGCDKNAGAIASAVTSLECFLYTGRITQAKKTSGLITYQLRILDMHKGLIDSVTWVRAHQNSQYFTRNHSVAMAMHYVFGVVNAKLRDDLFENMIGGTMTNEDRWSLPKAFKTRMEKVTKRGIATKTDDDEMSLFLYTALIIKVWNAFAEGKASKKLQFSPSHDAYPTVVGLRYRESIPDDLRLQLPEVEGDHDEDAA